MSARKVGVHFLAIAPVVACLAWYAWPTPYRVNREAGGVFRVSRFTGLRQQWTTYGWKSADEVTSMEVVFRRGRERMIRERQAAMLSLRAREAKEAQQARGMTQHGRRADPNDQRRER